MDLHVLCGDDDLAIRDKRAALLAGSDALVERLDIAADGGAGLVAAVGSRSMFGGRRVVAAENFEALTDRFLADLVDAAEQSDALVVARCVKAPATKVRNKLKKIGTVTTTSLPKGKGVAMAADALLAEAGIRVAGQARKFLLERVGDDSGRLRSIIAQLRLAGMSQPTQAQLAQLVGSASSSVAPWDVTDAVEKGDVVAALEAAAGLEPVAVVAFCGSRASNLGRILEQSITSPDVAAEVLGIHRFPAERLIGLARRVDAASVASAWDAIAAADRAVKGSPFPRAVVDGLLMRLCELWGPVPVRH